MTTRADAPFAMIQSTLRGWIWAMRSSRTAIGMALPSYAALGHHRFHCFAIRCDFSHQRGEIPRPVIHCPDECAFTMITLGVA
jgi:hypothetical protein